MRGIQEEIYRHLYLHNHCIRGATATIWLDGPIQYFTLQKIEAHRWLLNKLIYLIE